MTTGIRVDGDGNNSGGSLVFSDGDGIVVKGSGRGVQWECGNSNQ